MIRRTGLIYVVVHLLLVVSLSAEVKSRHILALYDSGRGQNPTKNHIHTNAETILNYLGCVVDYWDIQNGLPNDREMQEYLGLISWFYRNDMKDARGYLRWASRQIDAGRKFVILGNIGAFKEEGAGNFLNIEEVNAFARKLGFLVDVTDGIEDITKIALVYKDKEMVEFERSLDYELYNYEKVISLSAQNRVYLTIKRRDLENSNSDVILTTPQGGFAASPYVLYQVREGERRKWRINPFAFFNEAFGLQEMPRADVTTLNGSRIWCSHIDGDALISQSEIKSDTYCGEIIRDEIIETYPWPISVSVVVGEVERAEKFMHIARSIYEIDWVEAASHSYAHPFYWDDNYEEKDSYEFRHLPIKGYTFDLNKEIVGSIKFIDEKLLPPNKEIKQFFWTGNCVPTAEALKLCYDYKINNINGGESVFDHSSLSYTGVAPIGTVVGDYRQIYSPNSNENIYTNEWQGPYYGFKYVLDTFKNTESPKRIKPINIYYHFYTGEKWAALNALKEVLDTTTEMDVAPMFVSEYTSIAEDFYRAEVERLGDKKWRVRNYGDCTTFRFDQVTEFPDLKNSVGVLGFKFYQGSLYVHLERREAATIVLTKAKQTRVYVHQASHRLDNLKRSHAGISFVAKGYGVGNFVFANLGQSRTYEAVINGQKSSLKTDALGRLTISHEMNGALTVKVNAAN